MQILRITRATHEGKQRIVLQFERDSRAEGITGSSNSACGLCRGEFLKLKPARRWLVYTHVSTQSLQKIKSPFDDL